MKNKRKFIGTWSIFVAILMMSVFFADLTGNSPSLKPSEEPALDGTNDEDISLQPRGTRGVESYDWPMFCQNSQRTGVADPILTAPDTSDVAWTFLAGSQIESSPAVVGDMIFFGTEYGNSDEDCTFYGLNETSGMYWSYTDENYNQEFGSSPSVAEVPPYGLMVFVGSGPFSPFFIYGFDATPDDNNDGYVDDLDNDEGMDDPLYSDYDIIWRKSVGASMGWSSPLVEYIDGSYVLYIGSGSTIYAIDAVDGATIWTFTSSVGGFTYCSPALGYDNSGNPLIYAFDDDGMLYSLDAVGMGGSTTVNWQYNFGEWTRSSPVVADDRVFAASWSSGKLICFDATPDDLPIPIDEGMPDPPGSQYDIIWQYTIGNYVAVTPAVHNGKVFVGSYNHHLYAFDEAVDSPTTSIIWDFALDDFYWSSPAVADGKVFIGVRADYSDPENQGVLAVDEEGNGNGTTDQIWFYPTSGHVVSSPAVANGKVYIGCRNKKFYAFGTGGYVNQKPYPPKLYSPENNEIVTASGPRFDWSEAVDIDGYIASYEIQIDDNSDFSSPEYTQIDIPISHYFPPFIADGTYYWRVRSKDDWSAYSKWSGAWRFTVDTVNDSPTITVLSPNGGEFWAGPHDIWWDALDPESEPLRFDVWLSDDSGSNYDVLLASNLASHVREWRLETTDFPDGKNYRVKVNVRDDHGLKSVDTSDADFEINNTFSVIYDDWPQFHHHENNTGVSPCQAPETNNINWIFDTTRDIQSSPAVYDGKVFIGDHNGTFYALDEATGDVIWQYDHTDVWSWCDTSPAIGYVSALNTYAAFFGLTIETSYNLFAMDIDGLSDGDQGILEASLPANYNFNGDVLWSYMADGSGASSASPTVFGDVVYIGLFPTEVDAYDSNLWAFDVNGYFDGDDGIPDDILSPDFKNADVLWHFDTHGFSVTSAPAVENIPGLGDVVYIGVAQGYWSSEAGDMNFFALDADPFDDMIDQGVADPPGAEYDLIWELNLEDYLFSSPAVAYGNVYVGTYPSPNYNPGNGGMLYCLDAVTGTTKWSYEIDADNAIYASPAVWNDMVYIPTRTGDNAVYAFDATPEDGIDEGYDDPLGAEYDIIWKHDIYAGWITSSPAVANGRVYLGAGFAYDWGEMYCLDAMGDGNGNTREIWRYGPTPDIIYGSPSVANGCVFVADRDGLVYKFGPIDGIDLIIRHKDITFSLPTPQENNTAVTIQAVVTNIGNIDASNVKVRFFDDLNGNGVEDIGEQIGTDQTIGSVPAYGKGTASMMWTAQPIGYHNLYVIVDPLDTIDEIFEDNNEAWTFFVVEAPSTFEIDYLVIRTESSGGGVWVGDRIYDVSATDTFYCAGYNNSVGYEEDISAAWESNDTSIATVTSPGISTTFTASDTNSGYVYVTATFDSMTNSTGLLRVNPPGVDYISIRDLPDNGGSWVSGRSYNVGATDTFYCAGYNSSSGNYVGDVGAEWTSSNTSLGTLTSFGTSTAFTASSTNYGELFVTATYNGLTNITGALNVLPPKFDYIIIRDASNNSGAAVEDRAYAVGDSDTFYCAGYNLTSGYLQDVSAYWESNDTGIATVTPSGISTIFTASTTQWGVFRITATYNSLTDETGMISVLEPTVDFMIIRDQPGNAGECVGDRIYSAGDSDTFYCAGYNDTAGYIGEVTAEWTSSNPTKGEVTSPGESTIFDASETSFGDVYVTASFNSLSNQTGKLTILFPVLDYILIRDGPSNTGEVVGDRTYSFGDSDTFYCAGYNDTVGYLGTFSASWSCSDTSIAQVRTSGTATTFTVSNENSGTVTVRASYEGEEDSTGVLTVLTPTVDYAVIKDITGESPEGMTLNLGESLNLYCAGYNNTVGFIENLFVTWESLNFSVGGVGSPGSSTSFQASDDEPGQTLISAVYQGTTVATANIVVVDDLPPKADAGEDQNVLEGETVQFDGTDSEDNVDIETYTWTFFDGKDWITLDGVLPQHEFTVPGTHEITLEVMDTSGNLDTDVFMVTVEEKEGEPQQEMWWLILLIFIIIAVVISLVLFIVTRKKKEEEILQPVAESVPPPTLPSVAPPPQAGIAKITRRIRCPTCKKEFSIEVSGSGVMSMTCPHCGTSGQMKV